MAHKPQLKVYEAGRLLVVGFAGEDVDALDEVNMADFRDQIGQLVAAHDCELFAFDLSGVRLVPSGLLGLLTSLRNQGLEVHLYNPSQEVREVLAVTNLEDLFPVHEVEI